MADESRIRQYGPLFNIVLTDGDATVDEAPDAGPRPTAPVDIVKQFGWTKGVLNKDRRQPRQVTQAQATTPTPVQSGNKREAPSFLYALFMCFVWSVVFVAFSIFAAVIHFDITLLSKRSGFVAWITRWLVIFSLLVSVLSVAYICMY
jgi:uncharacterized membrane protein